MHLFKAFRLLLKHFPLICYSRKCDKGGSKIAIRKVFNYEVQLDPAKSLTLDFTYRFDYKVYYADIGC